MKRQHRAAARTLLGSAAAIGLSVACTQAAREGHENSDAVEQPLAVRGGQATSAVLVTLDPATVVPAVISWNGRPYAGSAHAIFMLECSDPAKKSAFYQAFGYSPSHDSRLDSHYGSVDLLTHSVPDAPLRFVSCTDTTSPVLQVFARIDADSSKGESSYLVRFADDPSAVYGLGCPETLALFNWSAPLASAVPVNRAVFTSWTNAGVRAREINCYTEASSPLPAVSTTLPTRPPLATSGADAALYVVNGYKFAGINSDAALYLISNGRGYPIACDSNPDDLVRAFGFPGVNAVLGDPKLNLSPSDPTFLASNPGQQPALPCVASAATVYQGVDEQPQGSYFQLDPASPTLLQFECPDVATFFDQTVVGPAPDGGAPNHIAVPQQALSYLFVDPNAPSSLTPILQVGCAGLSSAQMADLRAWFFEAYGRYPTSTPASTELSKYAQEFKRLLAQYASTAEPARSALVRAALRADWSAAIRANELAAVVDRAIASAPHKPSLAPDARGLTVASYLVDKVGNHKGSSLDSLYDLITAFVDAQSPLLAAKMHNHFYATFGGVPGGRSESEFNAALMENSQDNTAWVALQHADNDPLAANAAALRSVVTNAVSYGKKALPAPRTNLDGGVAYPEDVAALTGYLQSAGNGALETGVYLWVTNRILASRPASRVDLLGSYDAAFGCAALNRTDCPIDLITWTKIFYATSQPSNGFDKEYLWQQHEYWLQNCYFNDRNGCGQQVDLLIGASMRFHNACNPQMKQDILGQLDIKHLYANFYSIDCWVKNNGDPHKDQWYCDYHQIPQASW